MSPQAQTKPAILYTRVSTSRQGTNGVSLDAQEGAIRLYCDRMGYTVQHSYREVGSAEGSPTKRNTFSAALREAEATGAPIIAYTIDRISRDLQAIMALAAEMKVSLIAIHGDGVSSDPVVIEAVGRRVQHEREMISQRTREALQAKKQAGVVLGNRTNLPEAQAKGRRSLRRIADEHAMAVLPIIEEIRAQGHTSSNAIAAQLNARGVRTARGGQWYARTVMNLLGRVTDNTAAEPHGSVGRDPGPASTYRTEDHPEFGTW